MANVFSSRGAWLAALLMAPLLAGADATRYVSDELSLDLRSGEGTQFRIVAMLPSGTRIQLLKESKESGYSLVRTPQGVEGWLLSRYLDDAPSARERLEQTEDELARLKQASASAVAISQENKTLKTQIDELQQERDTLQQQNTALKDRSLRDWFVAGAGVVLIGIVIGLVIPKIRWKRKSAWNRF